MDKVSVNLAFSFVCPNKDCNKINFVESVPHEFDQAEIEEFRAIFEDAPENGMWCCPPTDVQCQYCNTEYEVEDTDPDYDDDDFEDDDDYPSNGN